MAQEIKQMRSNRIVHQGVEKQAKQIQIPTKETNRCRYVPLDPPLAVERMKPAGLVPSSGLQPSRGEAAQRGAHERGDRVALEHDEAQQAAAPEDGHRELYSIGALPSVLHVLDLTLGKGFLFIYFSLFMEGHVARCLPSAVICRVFFPYLPSVFLIFVKCRSLPSVFQ